MRKRTQARELALQLLYESDVRGFEPTGDPAEYLTEQTSDQEVRAFAGEIVLGALEHRSTLDGQIREVAANWDIARMAVVDRNILRMAVFEMTLREDTPAPVIINEAIELAKKYGAKESGGFVNGILDKIRERWERRCSKESLKS
ncbi:MAG: transcription antitermination factor NusB [Planctomycetes bacterium]|nr:transcription antitermination factor NusB [Planctomycetota bacterium]